MIKSAAVARANQMRSESAADTDERTALSVGYLLLGLAWGLAVSFSQATANARLGYGIALTSVFVILALRRYSLRRMVRPAASSTVVLVMLHSAFSMLSGALNGSSPADVGRYAMLIPAVLVFAFALTEPRSTQNVLGLRLGLTVSGVIFVLYHVVRIDWARFLDPFYRPFLFLNPNGTSYVCAVCSLSLLDYAFSTRSKRWRVAASLLCIVSASVVIATKSRTGLASLVLPAFGYLVLRLRTKTLAVLLAVGTLLFAFPEIWRVAIELWAPAHRPLQTLGGRSRVWAFLVEDLIAEHWLTGIGPGNLGAQTWANVNISGAHNALLRYLSEVGVLGTLPLLVSVLQTSISVFRHKADGDRLIWIAVFLAGLIHSLAEAGLYSMGSYAALMFMFSVSILNDREPKARPKGMHCKCK